MSIVLVLLTDWFVVLVTLILAGAKPILSLNKTDIILLDYFLLYI